MQQSVKRLKVQNLVSETAHDLLQRIGVPPLDLGVPLLEGRM